MLRNLTWSHVWVMQTVSEPESVMSASRSLARQTITWRISTFVAAFDWLRSGLMRLPLSPCSSWPLCWWPNSKVIRSSPMWQRGRTSGIHSITNGPASFGSAEPAPANTHESVNAAVWTDLLAVVAEKNFEKVITDFEEGAELHRPYSLWSICPVSLR